MFWLVSIQPMKALNLDRFLCCTRSFLLLIWQLVLTIECGSTTRTREFRYYDSIWIKMCTKGHGCTSVVRKHHNVNVVSEMLLWKVVERQICRRWRSACLVCFRGDFEIVYQVLSMFRCFYNTQDMPSYQTPLVIKVVESYTYVIMSILNYYQYRH